ncbi:MAG: hypothetical protein JNK75_06110 [Betaproteobacteria bacterium]|nr:hypothetical protein [Betaproteobacteria bacterium]
MRPHLPKPPFSLAVMGTGLVILMATLVRLDPAILLKPALAEGWVSNVVRMPRSGATRTSEQVSYGYQDRQGQTYLRSSPALGFAGSGDRFRVLHHRDQPGRHWPLTFWGLLLPSLALLLGGVMTVHGWRESRWVFPIWRNAWRRSRDLEAAGALDPVIASAAKSVLQAMAKANPPLRRLDWFHHLPGSDPAELAVWFVLVRNADYDQLVADGRALRIDRLMRDALREEGYPAKAVDHVFIGFKTREAMKTVPGERRMTPDTPAALRLPR